MKDGDRLELVEWEDITSIDRWVSRAYVKAEEPLICLSVGWVIKETDAHLWLSCTKHMDTEGLVTNTFIIMKSVIIHRTLLRRVRLSG